jgi:hypothetical protein
MTGITVDQRSFSGRDPRPALDPRPNPSILHLKTVARDAGADKRLPMVDISRAVAV